MTRLRHADGRQAGNRSVPHRRRPELTCRWYAHDHGAAHPSQYANDIPTPYVSGHINTANAFEYRYGYAEMRAKVPAGAGLLSTFYALRTDKAALGELDALEYLGVSPKALY